jgi:hypothetical protein
MGSVIQLGRRGVLHAMSAACRRSGGSSMTRLIPWCSSHAAVFICLLTSAPMPGVSADKLRATLLTQAEQEINDRHASSGHPGHPRADVHATAAPTAPPDGNWTEWIDGFGFDRWTYPSWAVAEAAACTCTHGTSGASTIVVSNCTEAGRGGASVDCRALISSPGFMRSTSSLTFCIVKQYLLDRMPE